MWTKRIAMAMVLATAAAIGGLAPAARAQTPGDIIYGDVDGDGSIDQVFLGSTVPALCSVIVQYGRPGGVFLPPVAYTYLRPGGGEVICPDVGVAANLALGSTTDELIVAWSGGPPPTIPNNLLVLGGGNFAPIFGISTFVTQPRYMNTADFNGDGRADVYLVGAGGQGFESYYSLGDGTLTIGAERWCAKVTGWELHDFNRDGATAALLTYTNACTDGSSGVVKVSANGAVQVLQRDPANVRTWRATVAFVSGDGLADVRTEANDTGEVEYFIQVPDGPEATFVKSPTANHDRITISGDRAATIPVLANDFATTSARVSIVEPPKYGTVQVTSSRSVVYRPNATHQASDRFVYRLTEAGRTSNAAVNIRFAG